jgi:hypothetical protein
MLLYTTRLHKGLYFFRRMHYRQGLSWLRIWKEGVTIGITGTDVIQTTHRKRSCTWYQRRDSNPVPLELQVTV